MLAGLYGGVQYDVVSVHDQQLLDTYYTAFSEGLTDRGLDPQAQCTR